MRTTLTLDDDVAERLRELAHQRRVPFRRLVNELLRRGMGAGAGRRKKLPFMGPTFSSALVTGFDPSRLNQLFDDLEADRFAEKARR